MASAVETVQLLLRFRCRVCRRLSAGEADYLRALRMALGFAAERDRLM
jgi:hypothetical protein